MLKIKVKVEGTKPLLMHKFSIEAAADLEGKVKPKKAGPPDPIVEAEQNAYRLDPQSGEEKGKLCLPGEHFYQTIVKAASGFQIKGQGKKTFKDPVKGCLVVEPDYLDLMNPKTGAKLYEYEIDKRPARIGTSRILRSRPRLEEWACEFVIVINDDLALPETVVNAILTKAGNANGVGDYRPRFGCFIVRGFEIIERIEEVREFEALVREEEEEETRDQASGKKKETSTSSSE